MVGPTAALGSTLAAVAGLAAWGGFGPAMVVPVAGFGLLATALQSVAVALTRGSLARGDYRGLLTRWGAGTGLRLLGVIAIPVAVLVDRERFPPLAAAMGYLAVLVPLLFLEIRRFR